MISRPTFAAVAILLAVALAWPGASSAQDQRADDLVIVKKDIELVVGDQYPIPTAGVDQYSEDPNGVVDFKLPAKRGDAKNFVLLALKPGQTSLFLMMLDGTATQYNIVVKPRERAGAVDARDNIRLDFYFVELTSGGGYRVGLAWPGTVAGTGTLGATVDVQVDANLRSGRIVGATAAIAGQVLPRLDLAQTEGWARVMRHASLVMTNGESGTFTSGGEVNVRLESSVAVGLGKIEHGTRVDVRPNYDAQSGRIEVKILAEVATLAGTSGDGVPGRNVTNVNTMVNLELGEAIVLGGLLGESSAREDAGVPWLSQLPVIGYLFGTHDVSHERTENVLIIVPSVVEAVSADDRVLVGRALAAYRAYEGERDEVRLADEVERRPKEIRK